MHRCFLRMASDFLVLLWISLQRCFVCVQQRCAGLCFLPFQKCYVGLLVANVNWQLDVESCGLFEDSFFFQKSPKERLQNKLSSFIFSITINYSVKMINYIFGYKAVKGWHSSTECIIDQTSKIPLMFKTAPSLRIVKRLQVSVECTQCNAHSASSLI